MLVINVIVGVAGLGKSAIIVLLATASGFQIQGCDNLHLTESVAKMCDAPRTTCRDRVKIAAAIDDGAPRGEFSVLICSALKRAYRVIVISDRRNVTLFYLKRSHDLISWRTAARHEHFVPLALLDSQFATLQEPTPNGYPITVDVGGKPADMVSKFVDQLEDRQIERR